MRLVAATSQHCISDSWKGIQQSYLWNMQNYCFNPMWKRQWATHSLPSSPTTQQTWHPMSQSHWMPNMNECLGLFFHHERLPIKSRSLVQVTEQHSAIAEKKRLQHHLAWTCPWHKNWSLWCVSKQTPTGNHTSTSFLSFLSTSFMTAPANVQQRQMTPRA